MKYICSTSVNVPTEATRKFAEMQGWTLVIAGDTKTPHKLYQEMKNVVYVTPEDQEKMDRELSDLIGWKSIQRRNFAFLWAWKHGGADIVSSVDDDNLPNQGWGEDLLLSKEVDATEVQCNQEVFEPLSWAIGNNHGQTWHRGYPIEILNSALRWQRHSKTRPVKITADIQANFWFGNGDVDAICRAIYGDECNWYEKDRFPFCSDKWSPFNSQNTFISKRAAPYYFMLPHTQRLDDIWNSYYCHAKGLKIIYGKPDVVQYRNPHDNIVDMEKEITGYRNTYKIIQAMQKDGPDAMWQFIPDYRTQPAYFKYTSHFE